MIVDYKVSSPPKDLLWNLTDVVTNHVSSDIETKNKILSQVKITDIQKVTKQRHTFAEYTPAGKGNAKKKRNKFLTFLVNGLTNKIVKGSEEYYGIKFPHNDTWLPFRALTINDSKGPFAQKFIRDRNLRGAMIDVNTEYIPQNEDEQLYAADFDPAKGAINFNKFFRPYSKTTVIGLAKHEAEHGWQYFLRSRFAEATTEWEEFIGQVFGKIKSKKLNKEAKKYTKSIQKYVALTKDLKESGKIEEYRENFIEKMAKKAAAKIRREYDLQGRVIRNDFPHIPKEYL